jgi:hypothetical protein
MADGKGQAKTISGIAVDRWYKPSRPERNPDYLRFIRRLPCAVCCSMRNIEAAHFGPRGLGQKADDRQTLPLCHKHHRTGNDSYHKLGPVKFGECHQLEAKKLIRILNTFFDEKLQGGQS